MKKVGIIGGMGPEATISLYQEIINIFQKKYNAKLDSDYPEIYIINLPIPDIVEKPDNLFKINKMVVEACNKLYSSGADFIVLPCNTINILYEEYSNSVPLPVLNIIDEIGFNLFKSGIKKIGLLATNTTYNFQIYEKYFKKYGIEIIRPTNQEIIEINNIIFRILSGNKNIVDKNYLLELSKKMMLASAEGVVLGCTDLPLIFNESDVDFPIFDTIKILAEKCVSFCMGDSMGGLE